MSYRRLEWRSHAFVSSIRPALVSAYHRRVQNGRDPVTEAGTEDGVRPEWRHAERVFAAREARGKQQYYVKWFMLGYAESTWEDEAALTSDEVCTDFACLMPICGCSVLHASFANSSVLAHHPGWLLTELCTPLQCSSACCRTASCCAASR